MREWRVGTLSMGLLLVGSGIGLLYGQFNGAGVVNLAVKWWPVIFIILGIEVLVQYYFRKSEDSKIKYDIFSIFMIILIVLAGLGIQAASEFGVTRYIQTQLNAHDYNLTTETTSLEADAAKRIVVHAQTAPHLTVRNAATNSVSLYGLGHVRAESRSQAIKVLEDNAKIRTHQDGDTLYIDLDTNSFPCSYYLTLPATVAVEIDCSGSSLELCPAQINNDWIIKGTADTQIVIPSSANVLVTALDTDMHSLHGNIPWVSTDGKPLSNLLKEETTPNDQGDMRENSQQGLETQFQAKLGNEGHKLTILESGDLTVNQLP